MGLRNLHRGIAGHDRHRHRHETAWSPQGSRSEGRARLTGRQGFRCDPVCDLVTPPAGFGGPYAVSTAALLCRGILRGACERWQGCEERVSRYPAVASQQDPQTRRSCSAVLRLRQRSNGGTVALRSPHGSERDARPHSEARRPDAPIPGKSDLIEGRARRHDAARRDSAARPFLTKCYDRPCEASRQADATDACGQPAISSRAKRGKVSASPWSIQVLNAKTQC